MEWLIEILEIEPGGSGAVGGRCDTPGEIKGLPNVRVKADALNAKEKLLPTRNRRPGLTDRHHRGAP